MSATEIRAAVDAARKMQPRLSASLADEYIAAGKTVEAVKADLVDKIIDGGPANTRSVARANMVKQIAARYGADAAAQVANANPRALGGVDPKASIIGDRSVRNAPAATASDGLTMGQRSMLGVIERNHGPAARAKAEARLAARAG